MVNDLKLKRNIQAFASGCFALTGVGFVGYACISSPSQQEMLMNVAATVGSIFTSYVCFVESRITNLAVKEKKSKKYFSTSY